MCYTCCTSTEEPPGAGLSNAEDILHLTHLSRPTGVELLAVWLAVGSRPAASLVHLTAVAWLTSHCRTRVRRHCRY